MGSSSSRLRTAARPHRPLRNRAPKRTFSSLFICGASSSHAPFDQIEDRPAELLLNSAKPNKPNKHKTPRKDTATVFTCSKIETGVSSGGNVNLSEVVPSNANGGNTGESFSENKELVASNNTHTAPEDQPFPVSLFRMENVDNSETDSTRDDDGSLICSVSTQFSSPSHGIFESPLTEDLLGSHADEIIMFDNSDSASASVVFNSPITSHSSRDGFFQETAPSFPELLVSERELHLRDGSIPNDDMASSSAERGNHESRRNRRVFWDAFSRRCPRSNAASRTSIFSNSDSDDVESCERWPYDLSSGSFRNGIGGNFRSHQSRSRGNNDQHHSRSEMQDRLHGDITASDHPIGNCPAGIHLDGACSCESVFMADESGSRASISRIVMLAEALFEVLDEIHQPMTLSFSMASLPASESIVDSFPVKNHIKKEGLSDGNDVTKCYICLAEYEEGDEIRVLPCHHEFHMLCVDKWLKEIHGVCPLCRRDVQEGFMDDTTPDSDGTSL